MTADPWTRILGARCRIARRRQRRRREDIFWTVASRAVNRRQLTSSSALLIDGRGDARTRHLREKPDLVMPPAAPGHRPLPEIRVGRVVDDPVFARRFERRSL